MATADFWYDIEHIGVNGDIIPYEIHRDLSSKIVDTEAIKHGKGGSMQLSAELDNIFQWFRCTFMYTPVYHFLFP